MTTYSYTYRMGSGIPGATNRDSNNTIEPHKFDPSTPFSAYGVPGKIVNDAFVPIASGDTADDVYGLLVRPYPTQGDDTAPGTGAYAPAVADVLKRGYISVRNNAGTPALNKPVYVRVGGATAGKPIGGIEAAPDSTSANTIEINAHFMSAGDGNNNVEIAYNI